MMDRDRDDPRNLFEQARQIHDQNHGRGGNRTDTPPGKFDMSDWDAPTNKPVEPAPVPAPSPAERTRSGSDFAHFFSLLSALETGIQRILANFGMIRDLAADSRASVAEAAADAAKRAEAEEARDKLITDRLIDPERLGAYAAAGAKAGVKEALGETVADLKRRLEAGMAAHELMTREMAADRTEHRADEQRRRRQDGWRNRVVAGIALLVPITGGLCYYLGSDAGAASAYARARDEKDAASWANTTNGKLARQLDLTSEQTIPAIAACPKDHGWKREKRAGVYWCFGSNQDGKSYQGWLLP